MFVLKNNPVGVKALTESFGGSHLQISREYFAWFPAEGTKLELSGVETTPTRRVERWVINGELLTVERLDTYDEIYKPISW